ncbi:hypothetical protein NUW54_g10062 [Trametes sanguinea]|uniref:Uncharacterized protein n=1 Tax=Trametes sanguinea TaxID=158606 RepID=A0ACC1P328_9APHY|nr:hypothetical protein NUW54_g10062 [Trametes sanguinea]
MRPTNRHQRISHSARKTPQPPRHSLARAKTLAGACEGLRRPPRPQAAVSGRPGARRAVPSLGALAERGTDLRSLERWARKRSRALRAAAAWFRTVSVTIQIPVPPRSASQSASASASASALRPAFSLRCELRFIASAIIAKSLRIPLRTLRTLRIKPAPLQRLAKLAKTAKLLSEVFTLSSLLSLRSEGRPTLAKTHRRRSPSQGTRHEPSASPPFCVLQSAGGFDASAACFRTIQIPVPPRSASQSASASASASASVLRPVFSLRCELRFTASAIIAKSLRVALRILRTPRIKPAPPYRPAKLAKPAKILSEVFPLPISPSLAKRRAANPRKDS